MSLTPSTMLPLGAVAPSFHLLDTISGEMKTLEALKSPQGTVVMFICNHCPYVKHLNQGLVTLSEDYHTRGISFIAINSNDIEAYPEDGPEKMKETAQQEAYPFVYLFDEDQSVAKAYQAACTPDFYIFNKDLACVYRGRFDDSTPGNPDIPVTGSDIRSALDNLCANKPIASKQLPSWGCNIKWKEAC